MKTRFVLDLGLGNPIVVLLECAAGTRLGSVWTILTDAAGLRGVALKDVGADGAPVGSGSEVGIAPLLDGAVLGRYVAAVPQSAAPLELRVVAGPDAGGRHPLNGRRIVGRSGAADIIVRDPSLSRRHVALDVRDGAVWATDLGSANGTSLAGQGTQASARRVELGVPFRLGNSTLVLRSAPLRSAAAPPDSHGRVVAARSAGPPARPPDAPVIRVPGPPVATPRRPMASLVVGLPAVASVVAGFVMGSPVMAVVGAGACLAWVAQTLVIRQTSRREDSERRRAHEAERAVVAARIRAAVDRDRAWRARAFPDLATVVERAIARSPRLWSRALDDSGALPVRLGTGTGSAKATVTTDGGESWHPTVPDCPVTLALDEGPTGVAGDDGEQVLACARSIILQLLTRHSPGELTLCVITAREESLSEWEWLRWPAHARPAGRFETMVVPVTRIGRIARHLASQATAHTIRDGSSAAPPVTLVLVDGHPPADGLACLDTLVRRPRPGVHVLWLVAATDQIPTECRQQVRLSPEGGVVVDPTGQASCFRPDGLGRDLAVAAGRSLAPLAEVATPERPALPDAVPLVDVIGLPAPSARSTPAEQEEAWAGWLMDAWRRPRDGLPMTIGMTDEGPMVVDLCTDGPHALVAGTTGSGKSELLRAMVVALAAANPPSHLAFVLVDYKGGAAFAECSNLPHATGLLTDFEGDQTVRALGGLRTELARREGILRDAGVDDLRQLSSEAVRTCRVPRMVIVVDEFRALAEDRPEVLAGLVRIASQGRSLGIHLVLATQRPAGIVSGDIRANAALRIALRVTDQADSFDVLGSDDAAGLPPATPGRAVFRCTDGEMTKVQVGRVGASTGVRTETATAVALPWPEPDEDESPPAPGHPGTDLERLVTAARTAANRLGLPDARPPWAPPLPRVVTVEQITRSHQPEVGPADRPSTCCCSPGGPLTLGLTEDVQGQRLRPLVWHPASSGHLAVCGGPGSGRTTLVRTLLRGLAEQWCPARLEAYLLDPGGSLTDLSSEAHVLGYAGPGDRAMTGRIVARLGRRVEERNPDASQAVLVVHGWESLSALASGPDPGRLLEDLVSLLRAGDTAGVRLVVSASRAPLLPPLATHFRHRVALGGLDSGDLLLAGAPHTARDPGVRGRGWLLPGGHACQVALVCPPAKEAPSGRRDPESETVEGDRRHCDPSSRRLTPLPRTVRLAELPDVGRAGLEPLSVPIGITQDGSAALLDLAVGAVLVAGPRKSGRTATLVTIAIGLSGRRQVVVLTGDPRRRPHGLPDNVTALGPPHAAALMDIVDRNPEVALLCDDAEAFEDTVVETTLLEHAGRAGLDRGPCVLTTTSAHAAASYRGAIGLLRRNGHGLVLSPGRREEEIFTCPLGCVEPKRPGLAVLVDEEGARVLQVATPGAAEGQDCLAPMITAKAPTTALATTRPPMIG